MTTTKKEKKPPKAAKEVLVLIDCWLDSDRAKVKEADGELAIRLDALVEALEQK